MHVYEPINITTIPGKMIFLHNVNRHVSVKVSKVANGEIEYLIQSIDKPAQCSSSISFGTLSDTKLGFVESGEFVFTDCKDTLTLSVDQKNSTCILHTTSPAMLVETDTNDEASGVAEAV